MTLVATQVKRRRGTTAENDAFTGAEGEITVDLGNKELRVHTGDSKQGGYGTARKDFENITDDAKNISNWSSNVSNCITNIPQDIKLELNNGRLTLKAGSKVYVPNGSETFDTITIPSDLTFTETANRTIWLGVNTSGTGLYVALSSETGTPATGTYKYYYDDSANKCYVSTASATPQVSLPIAIIKSSTTGITSIEQVFNGYGYCGRSTFVLPGVKALVPNGRNADGTLKNTELNFTSPVVYNTNANSGSYICFLSSSGILSYGVRNYFEQDTEPTGFGTYATWFDTKNNIIKATADGGTTWIQYTRIYLGVLLKNENTNITSFVPKQTFCALNHNDTEYIGHQAMPDAKQISFSLPASDGQAYSMPSDGYFYVRANASSNQGSLILANATTSITQSTGAPYQNFTMYVVVPVAKGDIVRIYCSYGTVVGVSFHYNKGSK